jgi:small-conductance mechanosensitive channel
MRQALAIWLALVMPLEAAAQVLPQGLAPAEAPAALPDVPLPASDAADLQELEPAGDRPLPAATLAPLPAEAAAPIPSQNERVTQIRALSAVLQGRRPGHEARTTPLAAASPRQVEQTAEAAKIELDARWDRSRPEAETTGLIGLYGADESLDPAPRRPPSRIARYLTTPASAAGGTLAAAAAAGALGVPWLQRTVLGHAVSTWLAVGAVAIGSSIAARAVRAMAERLLRRSKRDPLVKNFVATSAGYAVYLVAAGSIAHLLGVDLPTLLGSLGVSTLAASFALKGPFGNVAGVISIVLDRPFRIGEKIQVGASAAIRGVVQNVSLARTRLGGDDGSAIDVPNSMFIENAILKLGPEIKDDPIQAPAASRRGAPWWAWVTAAALPAAWLAWRLWQGRAADWLSLPAVAGLAWLAARVVRAVVALLLRRSAKDPMLKSLLTSAAAMGVYLVAGIVIARMLGVNLVGLMGSLSVTSMALGYILRAPLSNIVGGLTILERRPRSFSEGDKIQIGSDVALAGTVEKIALTRTILRSGDTQLWVPNQMFIETPVVKLSDASRP